MTDVHPQQWDTYEDYRRNPTVPPGPPFATAICLDAHNRVRSNRLDMVSAEFPVRWLWPEDVAELAQEIATLRAAIDKACSDADWMFLKDFADNDPQSIEELEIWRKRKGR